MDGVFKMKQKIKKEKNYYWMFKKINPKLIKVIKIIIITWFLIII